MSPYTIDKFAVVGAGNMGSGIAQKIAAEGYTVVLLDLDDEKVARGVENIRRTVARGVERGVFRAKDAEALMERVHGTSRWEDLAQVDLVVEAVFEDLEVKREVFQHLGEVCRPHTILATNTSSFYVKDLASVTAHPERVIGLHYFYHPAMNRLVEVIGHSGSDSEALQAAWASQEGIGKTPIRSSDAPGFVVNRFFVPWVNEAVRMLDEGVADIPTIEWAAKKAFRIGMGPFQLMNVTGVPISLHAANTLGSELGAFYMPAAGLKAQVDSGANWPLEGKVDESRYDVIADRLLGLTFYVASKLVDEGVGTAEDTDIGARVGLRWAKGPFELLNRVGVDRARLLAEAVARPYGLEIPELLAKADPAGIPLRLVSFGRNHGMSRISLNRPASLNALDSETVLQLENAIGLARADGGKGIVLGGTGKAFIGGADVKFFLEHLEHGEVEPILAFAARGQALFDELNGGSEPVVARVHGMALGGGVELALACDWIVASPKASFTFPETGIGIYPGLGGTQRLARRIGLPLAKWMVYTGEQVDATTAAVLGLIDAVATFAELDATCALYATRGISTDREAPTTAPGPEWQPIWDFFLHNTVDEILSGRAETGGHPQLEKAVQRMARKSYHALCEAERVFDEGRELPLKDALRLELDGLREVFGHPDALAGISALVAGETPVFEKTSV